MKVHEYQARELLEQAGIAVPAAEVIESAEAAGEAYRRLTEAGAPFCVVKAQVHTGGRGKAGGVKLVRSADEAREAADAILSRPLVTHQTGPAGVTVRKLLIAAAVDIAHEYYVGITVDRTSNRAVLIASAEGGVEIEQVAATNPDAILRAPLHPLSGLPAYRARQIAFALGFKGKQVSQAVSIMMKLSDLFVKHDASLLEINPLVLTPAAERHPDGQVVAIDAKLNFDDNALFRQPAAQAMHDPAEEDATELDAHAHGLSYIKLDGQIGCLVNGAGLAMSTMDIIKLHGGEPANFLDVGGGASEEAVTQAFRIILADANVRGVLVNIFGGIMQCDRIARAIVSAAHTVGFTVPLVVRLEGTNVEPARKIIDAARADLPTLQTADDLTDAAQRICGAVAA
jgi:succinyl-CoA synthetase beta subunit